MKSLILREVVRITIHIMLLFSLFLLVKGHNTPGGGFIAGLMTASAIVLEFLSEDLMYVRKVFNMRHAGYFGVGIMVSFLTGILPVFIERVPFLTSYQTHLHHLPVLGDMHLVSAAAFDLGVYLVVVFVTITIIENIAGDE
ncbi:Na(+)/H(+) antiporter subunit B [candidate division KSB1 bacterium]|nr:Na(+)/H(+) antiporter subunit B [candidate division KSB1 bacterium]